MSPSSRSDPRSTIPHMALEHSGSEEEEWKMESLHRLHRSEQSLPERSFPFPRIDQLVDSASGHDRLSFLDAFQGYHQIPMNVTDQEKTTFITPRGA